VTVGGGNCTRGPGNDMSWFPERFGYTGGELPGSVLPDEPVGSEFAAGVVLERRQFLWAGGLALLGTPAAVVADGPPAGVPHSRTPTGPAEASPARTARRPESEIDDLRFEEFVRAVRPLAEELVVSTRPNEDAYLFRVAALLARLRPIPEPLFARPRNGLAVGQLHRALPVAVVQLRMEPYARLALHDHRNYSGILFGVEGQARVRNFEFVDPNAARPSGRSFEIRQTAACLVTPGRCSTLARARDNLHEVVAGRDGARLLDVFTMFTRDARSFELDFRDRPIDRDGGIYEASWK